VGTDHDFAVAERVTSTGKPQSTNHRARFVMRPTTLTGSLLPPSVRRRLRRTLWSSELARAVETTAGANDRDCREDPLELQSQCAERDGVANPGALRVSVR